jgi:hypothetical protein
LGQQWDDETPRDHPNQLDHDEAIRLLRACHDLLARIDASGQGIYYQPTPEDRPIVEGVMRVCAAYGGDEHELELRLLRQQVGLTPSGWSLVHGMVQRYALSLPGVAQRRLEHLCVRFGLERPGD